MRENDIVGNYESIGISILKNFYDYYCAQELDDAEYLPVVNVIINGIQESMLSSNVAEKEVEPLKNRLSHQDFLG